jgi:hypothetical protein
MRREFRLDLYLPAARYVLDRAACGRLLAALEALGEDCGAACRRMREDLRAGLALADVAADAECRNVDAERSDSVTEAAAAAGKPAEGFSAAEAEDGRPRCGWCEEPGEALPADEGGETLWTCRTDGCPRRGRRAGREAFSRLYGAGNGDPAKNERGGRF